MPPAAKARRARICSRPTRAFDLAHDPELAHAPHPMLAGLSGSLVSHYFAERILRQEFSGRLGEASLRGRRKDRSPAGGTRRPHSSGRHRASDRSGTWPPLRLSSCLASPLTSARGDGADTRHALLDRLRAVVSRCLPRRGTSRSTTCGVMRPRRGIDLDAAWVLCTNGRELRLVDTQRTYSRAYLQFDLQQAAEHPPTFDVFWGLLREEAFRCGPGEPPLVLEIIRSSARHGQAVSRSLRVGVIEAVQHLLGGLNKCGRHDLSRLFDESLTVVYRVLFLMFAESRGLVPNWHPIYRESYTVESLRERAERPGKVPGLWEALQAIARLAHNGLSRGKPRRAAVQRPAVLSSALADRRIVRRRRRGGAAGAARAVDHDDRADLKVGTTHGHAQRQAHAHRLSRPRRRAARRGVRKRARLRARLRRLETRSDSASARRRRAQVDRLVLHAANAHRLCRAAHAASAGRRRVRRSHSSASRRGSGDGQRGLSRLGVPISRARLRTGAGSRRLGRRAGHRRSGPRAVQAARRAAMSLRRRPESDGGAARAPVALARDAVGQQAADVSRSPPRLRQQPDRRVAHRHRKTAARRALAAAPAESRRMPLFSDADLEPSLARAVVERRWLADTRDDTADVVREKERRLDALARRRSDGNRLPISGARAGCGRTPSRRRIRRCSHRSPTN